MTAIIKIEIEGFKAFPQKFELELDEGKNLLLYGENGSGKSSIYYALHVFLQSVFKDDKGAKYFSVEDARQEHLINLDRLEDVTNNIFQPYIRISFDDGIIWTLNRAGLMSENGGNESDIRLLNRNCLFINHSFISRFHSARNSEEIDLWNVFYKDILPFYLPANRTQFLADTYDEIYEKSKQNPSPSLSNKSFKRAIEQFNKDLEWLINDANTRISDIYNNNFKNTHEGNIDILLCFYSDTDTRNTEHIPYYLFYGNNRFGEIHPKRLYNPQIGIQIKDNGKLISKPQTYFNEAKLTAIALAVRMACLNMNLGNRGFMALDDMLISLDMSNRTKVIKYLLDVISDKYNIYLFTHDRAFFELTKEVVLAKGMKDNWTFKEIYNSKMPLENPKCYTSENSFTRAKYHFENFDYPASANYLRKTVEELMLLFPPYISKNENGTDKEKLRAKIDSAKNILEYTDGNITDIQRIIFSLGTLLNPLSHRSIDTNIYRTELETVMDILPRLRMHVLGLQIKEVIALENDVILYMDETENKKCEIRVRLRTPLYSYLDQDGTRKLSIAKGETIESVTIENGIPEAPKPYKYCPNATLEEICKNLHKFLGKSYMNNYIDFYKDKNGNSFNTLLQ